MSQTNTIVRAFELARGGSCRTVEDIRQQLKRERCEGYMAHMAGASIRKQLNSLLSQSRTVSE